MNNEMRVDINAKAMVILCHEYDKLHFIPDFKTRIDTAKVNFAKSMLDACDCMICNEAVELIINTKFYSEND